MSKKRKFIETLENLLDIYVLYFFEDKKVDLEYFLKNNNIVFHKNFFFPEEPIELIKNKYLKLKYSTHAINDKIRIAKRKIKDFALHRYLPKKILIGDNIEILEVGIRKATGELRHLLVKMPLTNQKTKHAVEGWDIFIAIDPIDDYVKTFWIEKEENKKELTETTYGKEKDWEKLKPKFEYWAGKQEIPEGDRITVNLKALKSLN